MNSDNRRHSGPKTHDLALDGTKLEVNYTTSVATLIIDTVLLQLYLLLEQLGVTQCQPIVLLSDDESSEGRTSRITEKGFAIKSAERHELPVSVFLWMFIRRSSS